MQEGHSSPRSSIGTFVRFVAAMAIGSIGLFAQDGRPDMSDVSGGSATAIGRVPWSESNRISNRYLFIANAGQWSPDVRFVATHPLQSITNWYFDDGWMLVGRSASPSPDAHALAVEASNFMHTSAFRFRPVGGTLNPPFGTSPSGTRINFFKGSDPEEWRRNVDSFADLTIRNVLPGIHIRWNGDSGVLEYVVTVDRRVLETDLEIECEGADRMILEENGDLTVANRNGAIRQTAPRAWQIEPDGSRIAVPCVFELRGAARFGFRTTGRNLDRPLEIDPFIIFVAHIGGSDNEELTCVGVDATNAMIVGGTTGSLNLPTTPGAFDATHNGAYAPPGFNNGLDLVVLRSDPAGIAAEFVTYLGGSNEDLGYAMAVEPNGNITMTGVTGSSDFPLVAAADTIQSASEGFVFRLDATGSSLLYSTYYGGSASEYFGDIALDAAGTATVVGYTESPNFPTTSNALPPTAPNISTDVVIVRFAANGTLTYATRLGGSTLEHGLSVGVLNTNEIVVGGRTWSSDFPVTTGAFDTTKSFNFDCFLTRIDTAASTIVASTFFCGGAVSEIDVDEYGMVLATGEASGTPASAFPLTPGAYQPPQNIGPHGFVAAFQPTLATLEFATYFNAGSLYFPRALSRDGAGGVIVAGRASGGTLPTTPTAFDITPGILFDTDGYIVRFDGRGRLAYGTFVGSPTLSEFFNDIVLAPDGSLVVCGVALAGIPTTPGAWDLTTGTGEGVVARFRVPPCVHGPSFAAIDSIASFPIETTNPSTTYIFDLTIGGSYPGIPVAGLPRPFPLNPPLLAMTFGAVAPDQFRDFFGSTGTSSTAIPSFGVPNLPILDGIVLRSAFATFAPAGMVVDGFSTPTATRIVIALPEIASVAPAIGPDTGGIPVVVTGTGFAAGCRVFLGHREVTLTASTPTTVSFVLPPHVPANVDVHVLNPDGSFDVAIGAFAYFSAIATVTGISPPSPLPGEVVTVSGSNFQPGLTVTLGGVPVTPTSMTSTVLTLTAPATNSCDVPLSVANLGGPPSTVTYNPSPIITSTINATGPASGGSQFFIFGANFYPGTTVTINGIPAVATSPIASALLVTAPAGLPGSAVVVVTSRSGCSALTNYVYL